MGKGSRRETDLGLGGCHKGGGGKREMNKGWVGVVVATRLKGDGEGC